jgi:branched-chain amino acid transport system substrate-binding protein
MIRKRLGGGLLAALMLCAIAITGAQAQEKQPIKIGFGMALTGGLAGGGKQALLAMEMWRDQVNAKGGLLGRPVQLVYYDDQSNPATVPALYTPLIDVDKVDFIVSGYGTAQIAPAMPIAIQHNMTFFGLFGLAVNEEFHYDRYFSMLPSGQDAARNFCDPFFKVAMAADPKPKTLAILAEDSQFPKNASGAIHDIAKADGLEIVYDKTYPPGTPDFTPIVHAIQATNPDLVFVASYPPGSVGMLRAATEAGLKTRLFGGGMVGLQFTPIKLQFGTKLNGVVDYDWWIPAKTMQFPGILDFLKEYQTKAGAEGVDPLGWYLAPFAYAYLEILGDAIEGTKGLDQAKISDYMHANSFKTIVGDIAFGKDGEWAKSRVIEVQWQGVKGNTLDDFKDATNEVILEPSDFKTGTVVAPYDGSTVK